ADIAVGCITAGLAIDLNLQDKAGQFFSYPWHLVFNDIRPDSRNGNNGQQQHDRRHNGDLDQGKPGLTPGHLLRTCNLAGPGTEQPAPWRGATGPETIRGELLRTQRSTHG